MRRTEKEIRDRLTIDDIIHRCQVCRLGLVDDDIAYIVPMSFGYDGQSLYFHGAAQGRKWDILRRNKRVCFEFDSVQGLIEAGDPCNWGIRYQSVIGTGTAHLVEDSQEKRKALAEIMAQYSARTFDFPEHKLKATVVIKVPIETITGKQSVR